MKLVVDASIVIKWLVNEADSEQALPLLDAEALAPDLLMPECANILWKKVQRKELSAEQAGVIGSALHLLPVDLFGTRPLVEDAVALALQLGHPAYNCIYLALARAQSVPLVTADRPFVERCLQGGLGRHIRLLAQV